MCRCPWCWSSRWIFHLKFFSEEDLVINIFSFKPLLKQNHRDWKQRTEIFLYCRITQLWSIIEEKEKQVECFTEPRKQLNNPRNRCFQLSTTSTKVGDEVCSTCGSHETSVVLVSLIDGHMTAGLRLINGDIIGSLILTQSDQRGLVVNSSFLADQLLVFRVRTKPSRPPEDRIHIEPRVLTVGVNSGEWMSRCSFVYSAGSLKVAARAV